MKHAVLILAHKNYPLLCRLIRYFAKDCEVFVHVDKKSKFTKDEIGQLYEYDSVKAVVQKYDVHWGRIQHAEGGTVPASVGDEAI